MRRRLVTAEFTDGPWHGHRLTIWEPADVCFEASGGRYVLEAPPASVSRCVAVARAHYRWEASG